MTPIRSAPLNVEVTVSQEGFAIEIGYAATAPCYRIDGTAIKQFKPSSARQYRTIKTFGSDLTQEAWAQEWSQFAHSLRSRHDFALLAGYQSSRSR